MVDPPPRRTLTAAGLLCFIRSASEIGCTGRGSNEHTSVEILELDPAMGDAFVDIDARDQQLCALVAPRGRVACYHSPGRYQRIPEPLADAGVTGAIDVAAGSLHACALRQDGRVACWGNNDQGQLGDGTRRMQASAVEVDIGPALAVEASDDGTCALLATGEVACWGSNPAPDDPRRLRPSLVPGLRDVRALLPDLRAIREDGTVVEWKPVDHLPQDFGPAETIAEEADGFLGMSRSQCVVRDGAVACRDQPYDGPAGPWVQLALVDVVELGGNASTACARDRGGQTWCWGYVGYSQRVSPKDRPEPAPVEGIRDAVEVVAGTDQACARVEGGEVWCWGRGRHLGLAKGVDIPRWTGTPRRVPLPEAATALWASELMTCAATSEGIWCWASGSAPTKAFERGTRVHTGAGRRWCTSKGRALRCFSSWPGDKPDVTRTLVARGVAAVGGQQLCTSGPGKMVTCDRDPRREGEVEQLDLGAVRRLVVGDAGVAAIRKDGTMAFDAMGSQSCTVDELSIKRCQELAPPPGLVGVEEVGVGRQHACARQGSGAVTCWGGNSDGQLGEGLDAIDDATDLAVGEDFACVLRTDRRVWCWGDNLQGQLGAGGVRWDTTTQPVLIPDFAAREAR